MPETADPLAIIGHTPIVELTSLDFGPCRVFAKLESQNPAGSIKDRIAVSMIVAAESGGPPQRRSWLRRQRAIPASPLRSWG